MSVIACPECLQHSKLKGEQYLQELMDDIVIVRTQWLYGRHGKNFVASVLRQAKEKGVLSIVDDQIGSPTYTVDLSKALSALIRQNARGIFHAANSDSCSWYAFGQAILKLSEMEGVKVIPISSKELSRRAVRPLRSVLDCRKLEEVTGMVLRPWSEGLKDYLSVVGFEK
jgi:dTDP-4-dehydrorhamnose reductase